jgi:hypothetical protein
MTNQSRKRKRKSKQQQPVGGNPNFNPMTNSFKPTGPTPGKKVFKLNTLMGWFDLFHHNTMSLNSSKFFAGIIMIMLNVGSKFITIQFSKSTEEYLKYSVTKQLLVFSMAWLGTRDIYTALILVAVFTILSDHLFNEESHICVVPHKYRVLHKLDAKGNDALTESELNSATITLNKANRIIQRLKEEEKGGNNQSHVNPYSANYIKT